MDMAFVPGTNKSALKYQEVSINVTLITNQNEFEDLF